MELGVYSDALAWATIGLFLAGSMLVTVDRRDAARYVSSTAWGLFGVFWFTVFPTFAFEMKSAIEGLLSLAAVPACIYTGLLLYRGREQLFTLSTAVAVMGVLYLPVETIPFVRQFLIETVTRQTELLINALGYDPRVGEGPVYGYRSRFLLTGPNGRTYSTFIITACTGIGSMAIFGGLIAAVKAPLRRKLKALAIAIPIIWVLNVLRNTFIAIAFGKQWFHYDPFVWVATNVAGYQDPYLTSFFIADRVLSQSLAVVALVGITYLVVRELPELLDVIEEVLFVATGTEYDLKDALDLSPVRADGGPDDD